MTIHDAAVVGAVVMLSGCAMTSGVMDTGNGSYMISAQAAPIRGGAAGANQVAYQDANAFCARQGTHAVVITADARDVYQGSFGASGSFAAGGVFAAGNTDLHFRCGN